MARPSALRVGLVCAAAAASACAAAPAATASQAAVCRAARVHYAPYPGGAPGLGRLPWVAGTPSRSGLVGLCWRIRLAAGGLRATVVLRAVPGR
jgi:hypothetical protein